MQGFVIGQRWLSETQSELGLGLVVAVEERRVEIAYRATGERRLYALPSPPLVRLELAVGESIRDRQGRELGIREVASRAGLLTYRCADAEGRLCSPRPVASSRACLLADADRPAYFSAIQQGLGRMSVRACV